MNLTQFFELSGALLNFSQLTRLYICFVKKGIRSYRIWMSSTRLLIDFARFYWSKKIEKFLLSRVWISSSLLAFISNLWIFIELKCRCLIYHFYWGTENERYIFQDWALETVSGKLNFYFINWVFLRFYSDFDFVLMDQNSFTVLHWIQMSCTQFYSTGMALLKRK